MQAFLGNALTSEVLKQIPAAVVAFYRKQNHPLADVVIPEQDLQSATLQVVVTEYRVGEVRAEGNKWFSDGVVTAPIELKKGDTINELHLLGQLDTVNANPFRRVDLIYTPSQESGYTDLVLHTQDRFPLRIFSGLDNSGVPSLGRTRWNAGANWGNAFGLDQQLTYQFSSSTDLFLGSHQAVGEPHGASFLAHSLSWTAPLPWHDSITVFGSYERSIPNVGQYFGLAGRSGQASMRYNHSLPRTHHLIQTISLGYDFKTTNNNLDFGGSVISGRLYEIDQFPLAYSAELKDKFGSSNLNTELIFSPGQITSNNTDLSFQPGIGQQGRPFAEARYVYWRSDFTRLTRLAFNTTWASRILGQVASGQPARYGTARRRRTRPVAWLQSLLHPRRQRRCYQQRASQPWLFASWP